MKKLLTFMIIAATAFIAVPKAEARPGSHHSYVSGRTSCGCPIYTQRYIAYYDGCGHPVYRTRSLPVSHRCRTTVHRQAYPHHRSTRSSVRYHHSRGASYNRSYRPGYYSSSSRGRCR